MSKAARRIVFLPLVLLGACGTSEIQAGGDGQGRDYATQIEVPSPDYEAIIEAAPAIEQAEILREASAPPPANAGEIGETWLARLESIDAVMGHGLAGGDVNDPISSIDTLLTAEQFDAWVTENGWSVPPHLSWRFQQPLIAPRVSEAARSGIRLWPASQKRTGWQLEAAFTGRIVLRDGCFFVRSGGENQPEKLAWFHAETGLDVDGEGYYVLIDRVSGQVSARVGEEMMWAGPNAVDQDAPEIRAYREACGDYEVEGVGNPQAMERMQVTYPHLRQAPDAVPPPGIH